MAGDGQVVQADQGEFYHQVPAALRGRLHGSYGRGHQGHSIRGKLDGFHSLKFFQTNKKENLNIKPLSTFIIRYLRQSYFAAGKRAAASVREGPDQCEDRCPEWMRFQADGQPQEGGFRKVRIFYYLKKMKA